jgi:2-hydroxychromene-2-carboxylate isomerase
MTDLQMPPQLTVWGDFACPWSALMSARLDTLWRNGVVEVDWRAVRTQAEIHGEGLPHKTLSATYDEVVQAATPDERLGLRLPSRPPHSLPAIERFAALDHWSRATNRSKLFDAVWAGDLDIGSPIVLDMLLPKPSPEQEDAGRKLARAWQTQFDELNVDDVVPVMLDESGRLLVGAPSLASLDVFL